jgi:56kDa selenium binding protein (SBP56).
MIENGVQPDLLLGGKYGHQMHVWDLRRRRHLQTLDLGNEQQMVLEMRPAHDPRKAYGFVGVVVSQKICPRQFGCGIGTMASGT